jgi:hypothetical protein
MCSYLTERLVHVGRGRDVIVELALESARHDRPDGEVAVRGLVV